MKNEEFNPFKNISEYADGVMQRVCDLLFDEKIAHDASENCVYFNDTKTKETYRIELRKCEYYEGE